MLAFAFSSQHSFNCDICCLTGVQVNCWNHVIKIYFLTSCLVSPMITNLCVFNKVTSTQAKTTHLSVQQQKANSDALWASAPHHAATSSPTQSNRAECTLRCSSALKNQLTGGKQRPDTLASGTAHLAFKRPQSKCADITVSCERSLFSATCFFFLY